MTTNHPMIRIDPTSKMSCILNIPQKAYSVKHVGVTNMLV